MTWLYGLYGNFEYILLTKLFFWVTPQNYFSTCGFSLGRDGSWGKPAKGKEGREEHSLQKSRQKSKKICRYLGEKGQTPHTALKPLKNRLKTS